MSRVGIFAKTFSRPTLESTLDAVVAHGVDCVQFNLACAGLPTLPTSITGDEVDRIRAEVEKRHLTVAALSGTFNMIDPDRSRRRDHLQRLPVLAAVANALDCPLITLCSGTRDLDDMWRAHPDNGQGSAWKEMLESMETALALTEGHDVHLGVEPEPGNVVRGAREARRLLDELRSPRLRIVMDGANIISGDPAGDHGVMLREAFDLVGNEIGLIHAKELPGIAMDWELYLSLAAGIGYSGAIILHGFAEREVLRALKVVRHAAGKADRQG